MSEGVTGVPFFRPSIGEEEIAEVVDCLRNGWLTTGPKTRAFEEAFAAELGGGVEAVAVNSATAALHLAVEAVGIGPGDEVIVPTMTFTATAEVVRYMGATPVLIDCEPDSFNIGAGAVAAAVTPATRAVMPVHFAGLPCDMTAIRAVADRHELKIIDDAAHALPAAHKGVAIGADYADATAFSFYANKTMTTGEGGMLVTRDPDLAARARVMRLHGISRDVFDRFTNVAASWQYDIVAPGFKYNLTDIAAAMGLHQLRRVAEFRAARARLCDRYDAALANSGLILPVDAPEGDLHSRHLYIVRAPEGAPFTRDTIIEGLKAKGIGTSVHYEPLHRKSYWAQSQALDPARFPNAEAIGRSCVSLPLFMAMTDAEQDYVIDALLAVVRG